MHRFAPLVLALGVALSCEEKVDDAGSTGSSSTSSDVHTSATSQATDPSTNPSTDPSTTASTTTTTTTTADETTTASDESTGAPDESLGCAFPEEHDTTDGSTDTLMESWGAACTTDDECVALVGEGGVCFTQAIVYELPNGYCTKLCALPDGATRIVEDDPACAPEGGVACVGQQGMLEMCAILCTDDEQCDRDGYVCRQLPIVAAPEDPSMCLMPDCCLNSCTGE